MAPVSPPRLVVPTSRRATAAIRHARVLSVGGHLAVLLVLGATRSYAAESPADALDFFEARIRPVLVERCYDCHGADDHRRKGGYRLDTRDELRSGGESGHPAVVPGQPDASPLIRAIRRTDPDLQMPPKEALPARVVADFEAWVRAGAIDPRTNAPAAVGTPDIEARARAHWAFQPPREPPLPTVHDATWPRTPVDRYILQRLESLGLRPAPPADRRTLIRRVCFDLWGQPPSPEEVADFEHDPDPEAFRRLVERLLASPRYGERWGRHWLDVARYADTKGYVYYYEESRFVHPYAYRDWVVRAFNEDLPYDRFLMLQIAADQLQPDPQRNLTPEPAGVSTLRWPPPVLDSSAAALGFLSLGRRFLDLAPDIIDDRIDVLMRGTQGLTVSCARCHDHKFDPIPTRDYYALYGVMDGSEERLVRLEPVSSADPDFERGTRERVETLEAKFRAASEEVAQRLRSRVKDYLLALVDVARLPSDANVRPQPEDINPYNVRQWERFLASRTNAPDPVFAPWHTLARVPADQFARQATTIVHDRGSSRGAGTPLLPQVARLLDPPPTSMTELAGRYGDLFSRIVQHETAARTNGPAGATEPGDDILRDVLYGPEAPVLPPRGSIVDLDVHLYFDDPNRVALAKLQMELEQWVITNRAAPAHAVILGDRAHPATPVVFRRGDPLQRGEAVPRQFLGFFAGPSRHPFTHGSGRLELARAIASRDNPLTARVLVNRVWAHHFGDGLVRTPSDFGLRSEPPSHPELLDWLACRFMDGGWSIKNLHRWILNSATYQQASTPPTGTGAPSAADPELRWLSHFPRQRLDLEAFRDSLLAVTGELDDRVGGPAADLLTPPFSRRRTLYGLVDRRQLPGMYRSFDFANPDAHSPRRHTTTMPQQALFLLNHPFLVERARALAQRLDDLPVDADVRRVQRLYERVFQRSPTPRQLADAMEFLAEAAASGESIATAPTPNAAPPAASPELNAWEQLAQVLLLSNEFVLVD